MTSYVPLILMYHSISDAIEDPHAVSVEAFEQHVSWLSSNGFTATSLSRVVDSIQRRDNKSLARKVVFTFDDGCEDFVTNALPILLRHGATATVFIVTHVLGEKASWSRHSRHVPLMSEEDVRFIKAHGISLGSHTPTHVDLTTLDNDKLIGALETSRMKLVHLNETFFALSYPWGKTSAKVRNAAAATGYDCAVKAGGGRPLCNLDLFRLPRVIMRGDINFEFFKTIFDGDASFSWTLRNYANRLKIRCQTR